ncbi:MAG TPA: NlpC/P60 family protein [Sphingobium sp.]
MNVGEQVAAEALALVGTPFRLRGRDPRTGLDCVGLAMTAFGRAGVMSAEPPAYQLRGTSHDRVAALLRRAGLSPAEDEAPGDLVVTESGPMQLHLMIRAGTGHVHAHAGLGRVVLMPGPPTWRVFGIWRAE